MLHNGDTLIIAVLKYRHVMAINLELELLNSNMNHGNANGTYPKSTNGTCYRLVTVVGLYFQK